MTPNEQLLDYLRSWKELLERSGLKTGRLNGYYGIADFVLQNGREFDGTNALCLKLGLQQCFRNAANLAMDDRQYTYCEGYAISIIPCLHAWIVDDKGALIETHPSERFQKFLIP